MYNMMGSPYAMLEADAMTYGRPYRVSRKAPVDLAAGGPWHHANMCSACRAKALHAEQGAFLCSHSLPMQRHAHPLS